MMTACIKWQNMHSCICKNRTALHESKITITFINKRMLNELITKRSGMCFMTKTLKETDNGKTQLLIFSQNFHNKKNKPLCSIHKRTQGKLYLWCKDIHIKQYCYESFSLYACVLFVLY